MTEPRQGTPTREEIGQGSNASPGYAPAYAEEAEEEEAYYEIESIVDRRVRKRVVEYRIRWKGYSEEEDTWEPAENLTDEALVEALAFRKRRKRAAGQQDGQKDDPNRKQKKGRTTPGPVPSTPPPWRVHCGTHCASSVLTLGPPQGATTLAINTLVHNPGAEQTPSFAMYLFGPRLQHVELPLKTGTGIIPSKCYNFFGFQLELLACRYPDRSKQHLNYQKSGSHQSQQSVRFTYVVTEGPDLPPINLREQLEGVANFAALTPHKVVSRLELLTSVTNDGTILTDLTAKDFTVFNDADLGNVGCGFIPETFLDRFQPTNSSSKCSAIQVRVIVPRLGVFKGMLCPKQGITKIQLPFSMRKVGKSKNPDAAEWACVVIKRKFPSEHNHMLRRQLWENPHKNGSPIKKKNVATKAHERIKPPGLMIDLLWQSLGVPFKVCRAYGQKCTSHVKYVRHSYFVGLADPSPDDQRLPKGQILLPHMPAGATPDKVFITRSPCREASDGMMLTVIKTKPYHMRDSTWQWLQDTYAFGVVIFGGPVKNRLATPERIAGGDLDGDTYFICWDETVLSHIATVPPRQFSDEDTCKLVSDPQAVAAASGDQWLASAQAVMLDTERIKKIDGIKGKLWNKSGIIAKESKHLLKDKLSNILAKAFKLTFEMPKHGGKMVVPRVVKDYVPKNFHSLLVVEDKDHDKDS